MRGGCNKLALRVRDFLLCRNIRKHDDDARSIISTRCVDIRQRRGRHRHRETAPIAPDIVVVLGTYFLAGRKRSRDRKIGLRHGRSILLFDLDVLKPALSQQVLLRPPYRLTGGIAHCKRLHHLIRNNDAFPDITEYGFVKLPPLQYRPSARGENGLRLCHSSIVPSGLTQKATSSLEVAAHHQITCVTSDATSVADGTKRPSARSRQSLRDHLSLDRKS